MSARILITGGFGYLGGRLAQHLERLDGYEPVLGSRGAATAPNWLPGVTVVRTVWEDERALEAACEGVDAICHLAGMNAGDCAADPVAALESNGVATARMARAASRGGVRRFLYLSTGHVYMAPLRGTIDETVCPRNIHPYATSHRAGEDAVRQAAAGGAMSAVVVRLSNGFGAPTHADANCWMLLLNDLARQCATTGRLQLRTTGAQRRDFIPIGDACRAITHLLQVPAQTLGDGLFNVGGGEAPTILEMTERLAARAAVVFGARPALERPEGADASDALDYDRSRLIASGFVPGGPQAVTDELDALLRFCRATFGPTA